MSRICLAAAALASLLAVPAFAAGPEQPYAGFDGRPVKALSAERRDDLLAGRGAGYALAAELNGLPGPRHVLDLAGELSLDEAQRGQVQTVFDTMQADASALGAELVSAEAELDRLFASREATPAQVEARTATIAAIEAKLRATHLNAHLATAPLLTPHQTMMYARARGYGAAGGHHGKAH